jgi:hypothetical protein
VDFWKTNRPPVDLDRYITISPEKFKVNFMEKFEKPIWKICHLGEVGRGQRYNVCPSYALMALADGLLIQQHPSCLPKKGSGRS